MPVLTFSGLRKGRNGRPAAVAKPGKTSAGFAPSPAGGRLGWGPAAVAVGTLLNQGKPPWFCSLSLWERAGVRASGGGKSAAFALVERWVCKADGIATGAPFAEAAGRVSPRRARHFSLSRQRKVPQRKATRLAASLRFAAGNLRCSRPAGSCSNSPSAQTVASPFPLAAALLGAARQVGEKPDSQTARQPDSFHPHRPAQPLSTSATVAPALPVHR